MIEQHIAAAQKWIDDAYLKLGEQPGFVRQSEQETLSKVLAEQFISGAPVIAEAPTGTGKTVAYLVAVLAAQHVARSFALPDMPAKIATATIALQEQMVAHDVPRFVKAGLLAERDIVVVKGASNYICRDALEQVTDELADAWRNPELAALPEGVELSHLRLFEQMRSDVRAGRWDGDLTKTAHKGAKGVSSLSLARVRCTGSKCEFFSRCGYAQVKKRAETAPVVVINHDYFFAATANAELPTSSILVFDEAHHLPKKALDSASVSMDTASLAKAWPERLQQIDEIVASVGLGSADHPIPVLWSAELEDGIQTLLLEIDRIALEPDEQIRVKGATPQELRDACAKASPEVGALMLGLDLAMTAADDFVRSEVGASLVPIDKQPYLEIVRRCAAFFAMASDAKGTLDAFESKFSWVRWLDVDSNRNVRLCASPTSAAEVLKDVLWDRSLKSVAMISATLRTSKGFEYYRGQVGAPQDCIDYQSPHLFDYSRSSLQLFSLAASPKLAEREQFKEELRQKLLQHIDPDEGTLVLVTSKQMLDELAPVLKAGFGGNKVRVQGEMPLKELLSSHKNSIDARQGSILMGMSTLAEGLDLPGAYCTHVCITALPFPSPGTPLEQELSDRMGPRYFAQRSLPVAVNALVQMAGRLVRRPTDSGRVSIFDNRILKTSYGKEMLKALPPFRIEIVR